MIERYSTPIMKKLWGEQKKIDTWMLVEVEVLQAMRKLGMNNLVERELEDLFAPTADEVREREKRTRHDLAAFVEVVGEKYPHLKNDFHRGLTSSDVVDTTNAILIKRSLEVVHNSVVSLKHTVLMKAEKYKDIPCVGRTHGMHAEIMSFGVKYLSWYEELVRDEWRLYNARQNICGKLSGVVGMYGEITREIEKYVMKRLGLYPEPVSSQVVPRDTYAEVVFACAMAAATIERISTEFRLLQQTEVAEAKELFSDGQIGSSAMAHKKNPVNFEQLCGISRLVRAMIAPSIENCCLWHERDISHSSVERVVLPDVFNLTHYAVEKMHSLIEEVEIFPEKMKKNIEKTKGRVFSQGILTYMVGLGLERKKVHEWLQGLCQKVDYGSAESLERAILTDKWFKWFLKDQEPDVLKNILERMTVGFYMKTVNDIYADFFQERNRENDGI